jgi:hypothetical protein
MGLAGRKPRDTRNWSQDILDFCSNIHHHKTLEALEMVRMQPEVSAPTNDRASIHSSRAYKMHGSPHGTAAWVCTLGSMIGNCEFEAMLKVQRIVRIHTSLDSADTTSENRACESRFTMKSPRVLEIPC